MSKNEYPPHWCKYCVNCLDYFGQYACWRGNFFKVVFFGPRIVKFDDACEKFRYASQYKQKVR